MSPAAHPCSILLLTTALGLAAPPAALAQYRGSGSPLPAVTWPGFAAGLIAYRMQYAPATAALVSAAIAAAAGENRPLLYPRLF